MDDEKKPATVMGVNFAQIPCYRQSLLSGIGGGVGVGLVYFMFSSNVSKATSRGFLSYICITLMTWTYCRYNWSNARFNEKQFKLALKNKILSDGTELERKLDSEGKEV